MKIISGNSEFTVASAIKYAATPSAYSYEGQLEKLQGENEKLRELVTRLVESMFDETAYETKADKLQYILGYEFKVEP